MLIFKDMSTTCPNNMVKSWPIHSTNISMPPSKEQLEHQKAGDSRSNLKSPTSSILLPPTTHQCVFPTLATQVSTQFSDMLIFTSISLLMYLNFDYPKSQSAEKPSHCYYLCHLPCLSTVVYSCSKDSSLNVFHL